MKIGLPQAGVYCLVAIVLASTSITSGQVADSLVKAKALYAEASYDEALAILKGNDGAEAFQYRALCLIALGRTQEAERALESLITVAPTYAMSDADLPPRLVGLFAQTRKRVLPGVVKKLFAEARIDFQAKNMAAARDKFEKVLVLTNDPAMADSPEAVDLRLLVPSYIDIAKSNAPAPLMASIPARSQVSTAPVVSAPPRQTLPPAPGATVFPSATPPTPGVAANAASSTSTAAAPVTLAASAAAAPATAAAGATAPPVPVRELIPAATVRQNVPAFVWRPGETPRALSGAVRVTIGADGKVKSAAIEVPVDPRYDSRLLSSARSWNYRPATLDGKPIESEKVVQINISK